ncbi:MAG: zinc ribbon domain-containing protein [Gammaproteobacteria bacterium]|nr:zinc ribbon domain-containing protein [Gammaproteobacteria bacterium]
MPIYDFRCNPCGQQCEVQQSMNAPPPICLDCGNDMERWFSSVPVVHGGAARGREQAARSLPQCGKGCRCCP